MEFLIAILLAPTNRIIDISLFLEKIVSLIVLTIRKTVTKINAITTPYAPFSMILNILIILSTQASP